MRRVSWGACTEAHSVTDGWPAAAPAMARAPLGSIGTGATRWLTNRARTVISAPSSAPRVGGHIVDADRQVGAVGRNRTGASGSSAASGSTTGASGS